MKEENEIVTLLLNFNLSPFFYPILWNNNNNNKKKKRWRRRLDSMCNTKSCRWFFFLSFIPLGFVSKPDIVSLSLSFPVSTFSCLTKEKWKKKKRERPFLDCCLRVLSVERERDENFCFFFLPFFDWITPHVYLSVPRESTLLVALAVVWMKFGGRCLFDSWLTR